MMDISNAEVAKILRTVAAAYTIKKIGNIFQIRAYENAADAIEHSTASVADLWSESQLDEVPALGEKIRSYLDELFTTGKVKHFEEVKEGIPEIVFTLLDVPGVGPKTAEKIAQLGVKDIGDLRKKIKSGELVEKGFSAKLAENLLMSLAQFSQRDSRILLPFAFSQAEKILSYLKKSPEVLNAHFLGSLRRMVATIGDLDFAASSDDPQQVIKHFCLMPSVARILDEGESKATVILNNGMQVDLLVGKPNSYGALLQHFTGSKAHNIKLRTLALKKGFSLSEYGVKRVKTGDILLTQTEEQFYKLLGMDLPDPEIREDTGEIEAAIAHSLPDLVKIEDIKGDLHLHSNFPLDRPSHAPGVDSIPLIIKKAQDLNYTFVGISDHSPSYNLNRDKIQETINKRTKFIQNLKKNTKSIRILNGLEIDITIDGKLSVADEILASLDYCIAGIHSGHRGTKEIITKRLMMALNNPYVNIISHPSNRLLNERESSDCDWPEIFKLAARNNKILEINASPNRLDLRDDLVRMALSYGVKLIINSDAHQLAQMENMRFGVAVARRGWATKNDIVNAWDWTKFAHWFKIKS